MSVSLSSSPVSQSHFPASWGWCGPPRDSTKGASGTQCWCSLGAQTKSLPQSCHLPLCHIPLSFKCFTELATTSKDAFKKAGVGCACVLFTLARRPLLLENKRNLHVPPRDTAAGTIFTRRQTRFILTASLNRSFI